MSRNDRATTLIANFRDGYASNWHFAVSEAFRAALDIRLTERIVNKKKKLVWTQGRMYCFDVGDILYDTPNAYTKWDDAKINIKTGLQIDKAYPVSLNKDGSLNNGLVQFSIFQGNENIDNNIYRTDQNTFVLFLKSGKLNDEWAI